VASASTVAYGRSYRGTSVTRRFVGIAALSVFALVVVLVRLAPGAAFAADVPTITGIAPAAAPSSGGTSVVISGTGFTDLAAASAVTFGSVDAASYTLDSDTQITAVTPAHEAGTGRGRGVPR
jgi:IPT/TIG domain